MWPRPARPRCNTFKWSSEFVIRCLSTQCTADSSPQSACCMFCAEHSCHLLLVKRSHTFERMRHTFHDYTQTARWLLLLLGRLAHQKLERFRTNVNVHPGSAQCSMLSARCPTLLFKRGDPCLKVPNGMRPLGPHPQLEEVGQKTPPLNLTGV